MRYEGEWIEVEMEMTVLRTEDRVKLKFNKRLAKVENIWVSSEY